MKNLLYLFLAVTIFACSSDDDNNNNDDSNPVSLSEWIPGSDLGNPQKEYSDSNSNLVSATISKMIEYNGELYVGGDFEVIGGQIIRYLARWDGSSWSSVGELSGKVEDMIVFQGKLYIQVKENDLSYQNEYQCHDCNRIYTWDGSSIIWEQLDYAGINKPLYSKSAFGGSNNSNKKYEQWTIHDNKLFAYISTSAASSWDGYRFELLWFNGDYWQTYNVQNNYHGVLKSYKGNLYATLIGSYSTFEAGFYKLGIEEAWDSGILYTFFQWINVAGESLSEPEILTIAEYNENLIVGGNFETIGGIVSENIASYDGNNWSTFGNWSYEPYELKVFNNQLYVSFYFGNWNGNDFERVAILNGNSWSSLLYNLSDYDMAGNGTFRTIEMYQNYLYLGGSNTVSGTNNFLKLTQ
jgi:hypothetical protein